MPDTPPKSRKGYIPGQNAPASGVYGVHHGGRHRSDHETLVIRGDEFPACRSCKSDVRYTLTKEVGYVTDDFDFAAPTELILARKKPAAGAASLKEQFRTARRVLFR